MASLRIGDAFDGRYEIERVLGKGGFATAFKAIDLELERPVVIKLLEPDDVNGYSRAVAARFRREARAFAALRHPNIALAPVLQALDDAATRVCVDSDRPLVIARGAAPVPRHDGRRETWDCDVQYIECGLDGGHEWPGAIGKSICPDPPTEFEVTAWTEAFVAGVEQAERVRTSSSPRARP